jgi:hypothetical protein
MMILYVDTGQYICGNVRMVDNVLVGNVLACVKYPEPFTITGFEQAVRLPKVYGEHVAAFEHLSLPYTNTPPDYRQSLLKTVNIAIRQAERVRDREAIAELKKQRNGIQQYGYPVPTTQKGAAK